MSYSSFFANIQPVSKVSLSYPFCPLLRGVYSLVQKVVLCVWRGQGCIFRLTCSYHELIEDHVLTSAYVKFFRTVTRNAVNKSFEGKKIVLDLP